MRKQQQLHDGPAGVVLLNIGFINCTNKDRWTSAVKIFQGVPVDPKAANAPQGFLCVQALIVLQQIALQYRRSESL